MQCSAEQILFDLISNPESESDHNLKQIIKILRARYGAFSEVEALLHMMDAIVVEAKEGRGW